MSFIKTSGRRLALGLTVTASVGLGAQAMAAGIVGVGVAPGYSSSLLYCVNADGTVAAGKLDVANLTSAARWTAAGQVENLGNPGGAWWAECHAISADGSVIFGDYNFDSVSPFRWTSADGVQLLSPLPPAATQCRIRGVTPDGSFAVGWANTPTGIRGVGWRPGQGLFYLEQPAGAATFGASDVSSDGSVIVGGASFNGVPHAFRWTAALGYQDLGVGVGAHASAARVSGDGSVIAGNVITASGNERSFRWTALLGMEDLGSGPPGWTDVATLGMSGDGSVIAGQGLDETGGGRAFLWRRDLGMISLRDYLQSRGVDMSEWTWLGAAYAVSGDGKRIAGYGLHVTDGVQQGAGFIATIDRCGSADFDGDGDVGTDVDIERFFACLAGNCCATCGSADFNDDGDVGTDADIESFFRVLGGGTC